MKSRLKYFLIIHIVLLCFDCSKINNVNQPNEIKALQNKDNFQTLVWAGISDEVQSNIVLILNETTWSDYEIKKQPINKEGIGFLSGILKLSSISKRGIDSDCKLPEERHFILQGRRYSEKIFLQGVEYQDNLIREIINLKFNSLNVEDLEVAVDNLTILPKVKNQSYLFKLEKQ